MYCTLQSTISYDRVLLETQANADLASEGAAQAPPASPPRQSAVPAIIMAQPFWFRLCRVTPDSHCLMRRHATHKAGWNSRDHNWPRFPPGGS